MFGQFKENILYNLDQAKSNPDTLKVQLNAFASTLKESLDLKKFYNIYEMVEHAQFDNEIIAKEFLDECLVELFKLNKSEVSKLQSLAEGKNVKLTERTAALDAILFNEDINVKEKYEQKSRLIKSLTDKTQKPDYKEMIQSLDKKVTSQVSKLTNEQKEALEVFMENDSEKTQTYYNTLIETTVDKIENKLLSEESVEVNKALIATKKKLQQLKSQKPTISAVDSIIELKADLDA